MDLGQQVTLGELSQAALTGANLTALLRRAVFLVAQQLGVEYSTIWELLPDRRTLLLQAEIGEQEDALEHRPITADPMSFADHVLSNPAPVIVTDWVRETRFQQPLLLRERGVRSSMAVIIPTPQVFGVLTADSTTPRTFADQEMQFLQMVANVLALALDRGQINRTLELQVAERTHAIEQARQVAESLHEILTILNSHQALDDILGYIIAQACRLLGATAGAIYRLHSENALLSIQASWGLDADEATLDLPVDWSATGQAVRTGKPVKVADAAVYLAEQGNQLLTSQPQDLLARLLQRYPALLAVPLIVKAEVYGAITFYYHESRMFSDEDVRLAVALSDQAALAIENARLVAAAQEKAVLEERQRLARDLHDSVIQAVYSIGLQAQAATRLLAAGDVQTTVVYLRELEDAAQDALEEMRLLIFELRPPMLEQAGLLVALQARLDGVEGRSSLATRLIVEGVDRLPAPVEQGLYRIAQEALNNTLKHAQARSLNVFLQQVQSRVILEITDDGVGFDPASASQTGGLGLRGIAERVAQLGGQLTLQSAPGTGTKLRVEITL